jgi:signal transduction histidine kinase
MADAVDILLVDDEPRNLLALDAILVSPSYRLLHATNADEALRQLVEHDVAVIVLDVMMPGTDGFALAKIMRGTKRFRQTPILFVTARLMDEQEALEGYSAGAVDYLTKPINPRVLQQKIGIFVELFRARRELADLTRNLEERVAARTAELARSEARLREIDAQRTAFLATLAHELRNPLAPLRTGLDLLKTDDASARRPALVEAMTRQLGYLVRLVDDLLDASRATRGLLQLRKAPADLADVLENALTMARPNIERRGQTLIVEGSASVRSALDETRVCQIISNLLDNASKFSPPGGEIRVALQVERGRVVIRVRDHGAGIPPGELDKVFDLFTTIDRSGGSAGGGLGIGLALSRQLARMHGGTLEVESPGEGSGATFTLSLPIEAVDAQDPARRAAKASSGIRPVAAPRSLKVVIVEDNEDAADILAMWLLSSGHDVDVRYTGEEGVELVLRARPDAVICDLGLPDIDGAEVCRRVRLALSAPPVMVALTGWGSEADRLRTREAGFDHHLVKPVQPEALRSLLESLGPREVASAANGEKFGGPAR